MVDFVDLSQSQDEQPEEGEESGLEEFWEEVLTTDRPTILVPGHKWSEGHPNCYVLFPLTDFVIQMVVDGYKSAMTAFTLNNHPLMHQEYALVEPPMPLVQELSEEKIDGFDWVSRNESKCPVKDVIHTGGVINGMPQNIEVVPYDRFVRSQIRYTPGAFCWSGMLEENKFYIETTDVSIDGILEVMSDYQSEDWDGHESLLEFFRPSGENVKALLGSLGIDPEDFN